MRLLHTADWHLGDRLGRIDRTDDLRRAVERVARCCLDESIDVLLVAGDLFSEVAGAEALRETIRHLQETLEPFMRRGGTVLTLTGNHDKENFCQTLQLAMRLATPGVGTTGEIVPAGRFYLATEPTLLRLSDPSSGGLVQFVLMPYPTASRYLTDEAAKRYQGGDEKNRFMLGAYEQTLQRIRASEAFDPTLPSVLSAHVAVAGSQLTGLFRLTEEQDVIVSESSLSDDFAYIALGHIHRAQALGGRPHWRYSGSIERMDFGEAADEKGVVVIELGSAGLVGMPQVVALPATRFREVVLDQPTTNLPTLRTRYPDAQNDLVRIVGTWTAGVDHREAILRELETIFPRWYQREFVEKNALDETLVVGTAPAAGFGSTVRGYVERELQNHPDAFRTRVLGRLEELFMETAE